MWNYDPQWIYKRVGALRLELGAKFSDKHKLYERAARMGNIPPPTSNSPGSPTSHVRVERGEQNLGRRAPSLHLAARGGHSGRPPHQRQGGRPRTRLRHRAQRQRAWLRLHPNPPQGRAGRDLPVARHDGRRGPRTLRLLPRRPRVRHASARRHRPRPRSHRHDPGRSLQPARGHRLPQDRQGHRPHGRRTHPRHPQQMRELHLRTVTRN